MAAPVKSLCIAVAFFVVFAALNGANGAGECGESTTPEKEAVKMASCAPASQNAETQVASECCALAANIVQNPACLCAVAFSETVKSVGGKPEIALTIPKRCGINSRPVGYKCGALSVP